MNATPYVTIRQAAESLSRNPKTLHQWRIAGRLECTRIGGRWYTTDEAIRRMIAGSQPRPRGVDWAAHEAARSYLRGV